MTILSIQSHVSFGHVGNAAGVFILRRMGFDVWPVHTVLFSNHPGYGSFRGRPVEPELVAEIISGIEERGVFPRCQAIVGGYVGSAATGEVLLDSVACVKRANPDSIFFCDPVMGDWDKGLYVNDDIVRFYKQRGAPSADILKPNAFELEVLTEQTVSDPQSAIVAAKSLIGRWGLRAVAVSSVPVPLSSQGGSNIACAVVTADQAWLVETPKLPVEQKGAGDAFMALFVAYALRMKDDFPGAMSAAVSAIWSIMNNAVIGVGEAEHQELQLVAQQDEFTNPSDTFKATVINLYG